MFLNKRTPKNKSDWSTTIRRMVKENPKNFPRIKSCLLMGLLRIKKIVFPSISRNSSWLPTNNTPTIPNISIIASPKSTITLLSSPIESFPIAKENRIKIKAKNKIRYKNLFLTISLNVLSAMLNMVWCLNNTFSFFVSLVSFRENSSFTKWKYIWLIYIYMV